MSYHEVARDGGVHVMEDMCSTCVFRPGNLMQLNAGRLRGMIDESLANDGCIPCHKTIHGAAVQPAVCRGFFDRHARDVFPLRFALATGAVVFDPCPKEDEPHD